MLIINYVFIFMQPDWCLCTLFIPVWLVIFYGALGEKNVVMFVQMTARHNSSIWCRPMMSWSRNLDSRF